MVFFSVNKEYFGCWYCYFVFRQYRLNNNTENQIERLSVEKLHNDQQNRMSQIIWVPWKCQFFFINMFQSGIKIFHCVRARYFDCYEKKKLWKKFENLLVTIEHIFNGNWHNNGWIKFPLSESKAIETMIIIIKIKTKKKMPKRRNKKYD